jgi:A/G-specific adenine glycosylase
LGWYFTEKRNLPWRVAPTPYRIWISEIMLQQTQVKTVIPYYERFLQEFPDLPTLAEADEEEVLRLWAGLGYYHRARNLLKTARLVHAKYGKFPEEFAVIRTLPGIGEYTAGAICSIALHQPYPAVDGNVKRILTRLDAIRGKVSEDFFRKRAYALLSDGDAASFNQALMDLGALVCTPRQPQCGLCPIAEFCAAEKLGMQNDLPGKKAAPKPETLSIVLLVLERNGVGGREILLRSAAKPDFIPGKWGLPCREVPTVDSVAQTAAELCRELCGSDIPLEHRQGFRHSITHHRITAHLFHGRWDDPPPPRLCAGDCKWVARESAEKETLSSLFRKALRLRQSGDD